MLPVLAALAAIIGFMLGVVFYCHMLDMPAKPKTKHEDIEETNSLSDKLTDHSESLMEDDIEGLSEEEKQEYIEEKRNGQTEAYNYTERRASR